MYSTTIYRLVDFVSSCIFLIDIEHFEVGTKNRTGVAYQGSFDIWTQNRISSILDHVAHKFHTLPKNFGPGGWVNGDNYVRSTEVFGILPLPDNFRDNLGMLVYHPHFAKDKNIRHHYLAIKQNTRMAVLPIHTKPERALFRLLVANAQGLFSGNRQPNWQVLASQWASHSDGLHIFYKVCNS